MAAPLDPSHSPGVWQEASPTTGQGVRFGQAAPAKQGSLAHQQTRLRQRATFLTNLLTHQLQNELSLRLLWKHSSEPCFHRWTARPERLTGQFSQCRADLWSCQWNSFILRRRKLSPRNSLIFAKEHNCPHFPSQQVQVPVSPTTEVQGCVSLPFNYNVFPESTVGLKDHQFYRCVYVCFCIWMNYSTTYDMLHNNVYNTIILISHIYVCVNNMYIYYIYTHK